MRLIVAACLLLAAHAGTAHAQADVSVTLNAEGQALAQRLGVSVSDLVTHFETRIDELYKISRIDHLLRQVADTAAFTQRGLGADYDIDPGDIVFGLAAAGIKGDVAIGTTNEFAGSVINLGVLGGANLGRWNHPRWTVFASGFYEETTLFNLTGNLLTLASHVQFQVVPPSRKARARWTGVAATTGVEYARWTLRDAGSLESHFTAEGTMDRKTIHMSSTGTLDVAASTYTIPLEVTTGARLFKVLAVYGGTGLSLTTGSSTITAQLDSLLTINSDRLPVGNATITGTGESSPSAASLYALGGVGIHTRYVRAMLQGAIAAGETSVSIAVRGAL